MWRWLLGSRVAAAGLGWAVGVSLAEGGTGLWALAALLPLGAAAPGGALAAALGVLGGSWRAVSAAAAAERVCEPPGPARLLGIVVEGAAGGGRAGLAVRGRSRPGEPWRRAEGKVELRGRRALAVLRPGQVVVVEGRLVRPSGPRNPGERGERLDLLRRGYGCHFLASSAVSVGRDEGRAAAGFFASLRASLEDAARRTLTAATFPLFASIVLGDRSRLDGDVARDFRASGLAHILAVSGLHVTLLAGTAERVLGLVGVARTWRVAALAAVVVGYAALTGGSPPVVRAAASSLAYLAARALGRATRGLDLLALAFLAELAWRPFDLFDPGFQLSHAATAGLLAWGGPWASGLARLAAGRRGRSGGAGLDSFSRPAGAALEAWLAGVLGVTLAAQAATLPLVLHHFGSLPLWGVAANVLAVPLAEVALPAGFLGCLVALLAPGPGWLVNRVTESALTALALLARFFAGLPLAAPALPPPSLPAALGALASLSLALDAGSNRRRPSWRRAGWVLAAGLLLSPVPQWVERRFLSWPLEAVFLDVGQGDAIVLWLSGRALVVDGGRWNPPGAGGGETGPDSLPSEGCPAWASSPAAGGGGRLLSYLRRQGVRRVDWLVVTHGDADHAGGALAVLRCLEVGEVWAGGPAEDTAVARLLDREVRRRRVPVRILSRGQVLEPVPGVLVEVLNPRRPFLAGTRADENNNGLVLRVRRGGRALLLAADLEAEGEADVLRSGLAVEADLLKVAHHGSRSSSTAAFLAAVRPGAAVVQVGPNGYGMPDRGVLGRLRSSGASVWRTDLGGAVSVLTDGRRLLVRDMEGRLEWWRDGSSDEGVDGGGGGPPHHGRRGGARLSRGRA